MLSSELETLSFYTEKATVHSVGVFFECFSNINKIDSKRTFVKSKMN